MHSRPRSYVFFPTNAWTLATCTGLSQGSTSLECCSNTDGTTTWSASCQYTGQACHIHTVAYIDYQMCAYFENDTNIGQYLSCMVRMHMPKLACIPCCVINVALQSSSLSTVHYHPIYVILSNLCEDSVLRTCNNESASQAGPMLHAASSQPSSRPILSIPDSRPHHF